eukprot:363682-Chlamydomonas_euryale.AAC.6
MGSGKAAAEPAAGALAASGLRPQHDASAVVQLLRGAANFTRVNTMSDRFDVRGFHSVEFWCSDATNTYKRCAGSVASQRRIGRASTFGGMADPPLSRRLVLQPCFGTPACPYRGTAGATRALPGARRTAVLELPRRLQQAAVRAAPPAAALTMHGRSPMPGRGRSAQGDGSGCPEQVGRMACGPVPTRPSRLSLPSVAAAARRASTCVGAGQAMANVHARSSFLRKGWQEGGGRGQTHCCIYMMSCMRMMLSCMAGVISNAMVATVVIPVAVAFLGAFSRWTGMATGQTAKWPCWSRACKSTRRGGWLIVTCC